MRPRVRSQRLEAWSGAKSSFETMTPSTALAMSTTSASPRRPLGTRRRLHHLACVDRCLHGRSLLLSHVVAERRVDDDVNVPVGIAALQGGDALFQDGETRSATGGPAGAGDPGEVRAVDQAQQD